jgi:hypothetical protein
MCSSHRACNHNHHFRRRSFGPENGRAAQHIFCDVFTPSAFSQGTWSQGRLVSSHDLPPQLLLDVATVKCLPSP